jgi:hypothetical protein
MKTLCDCLMLECQPRISPTRSKMKNCTFLPPLCWLLVVVFLHFFVPNSSAQSCSANQNRSLYDLQLAVKQRVPLFFFTKQFEPTRATIFGFALRTTPATDPKQGVFLPRWSAEDLPFFCKIEHDWAKKHARIPLKFRLGSVEYVDWLEGK